MCDGSVTELLCGHLLISFSARCEEGCALPDGPRQHLNDTCAYCHPNVRARLIQSRYDQVLPMIMARIRAARAAGDEQLVRRLSSAVVRLSRQRLLDAFESNKFTRGTAVVMWPGDVQE